MIKLVSSGTPYVAYQDVANGSKTTMMKYTLLTDPADSISLDATKYTLSVGDTHATEVRSNKNDNSTSVVTSDLTFKSSNTAVATVSDIGIVTGVAKGTVSISTYYATAVTSATRYSIYFQN